MVSESKPSLTRLESITFKVQNVGGPPPVHPGTWLGHGSREGRQGGSLASFSAGLESTCSQGRKHWSSVGSSLSQAALREV